jgi:Trypsin/Bacterial Ig domain
MARGRSFALSACSVATVAFAAAPAWAETGDARIVGGSAAQRCQWPSTVMLSDGFTLCTGILVHARIVLYAGHCGTAFTQVEFGEQFRAGYTAPLTECRRRSDSDGIGPLDYAYCVLEEPVSGVPIAPVLYGCEGDVLTPGSEVVIVGFGEDDSEQVGNKRWARTSFGGTDGSMLVIGGDGVSPSFGDSGGPAFVRLDDGSWRAFGLVSGGVGPGQPSYYVDLQSVVTWVESESGHDITPCHAQESVTWQPGYECGGFATTPLSTGSWDDQCSGADPLSGRSSTCGAAGGTDDEPPRVAIRSPEDGAVIDEVPAEVTIEIDASDDASGVRRVRLEVDGEVLDEDAAEPWAFTGRFPKGSYTLTAVADDAGGNTTRSDERELHVGEEPGGCLGCRVAGEGHLGSLLAAALAWLAWRRRGPARRR